MLGVLAAMLMQAAGPEHLVTRPMWLNRPTADDIVRVYPPNAARAAVEGYVILDCGINASGIFEDCRLAEGPNIEPELFIEPALKLSKLFKMATVDAEGHEVSGGRLKLPIGFWLPGGMDHSPVHVNWSGVKTQVSIDCRARPDGHVDNCLPRRVAPFSEAAKAALDAAAKIYLGKGPPSPARVHIPVELEGSAP
jgi:hypothetical protein